MFNTPILFIIFNRPETTEQVFERIRQIQPERLYVAADGARKDKKDDAEKCTQARAIIDKIDWPCELITLFREENLGCKIAVSSAITWFFENEEYGIILEDDCLPDLSFFPFCEELLLKYKDDDRIGHIGGNNFVRENGIEFSGSYDFCTITHIWGWATWKRAWKNYDVDFSYWQKARSDRGKKCNLFHSQLEKIYFSSFLSDSLFNRNGMNTWDVQWLFSLRVQNQLSIYPSVNLVTNIGLGSVDATHISWKNKKNLVCSSSIPLPLKHPAYVMRNQAIDDRTIKLKFFSWKRLIRYLLNDY